VALGKMESEGLVRREADTEDMRQVKVYLTEKGREKVDQVRSIFRGADADMVKGIPQEELDAMMATMRKILKNLLEEEDK
jgi:DNA-binding MarR family transcriptional regulator